MSNNNITASVNTSIVTDLNDKIQEKKLNDNDKNSNVLQFQQEQHTENCGMNSTTTTTTPIPTPKPSASTTLGQEQQQSTNIIDDNIENLSQTEQATILNKQPQGLYGKELRCMMYGFGDDRNPYTETVELLESLVLEFIAHMTRKAYNLGNTQKITVDDIMFLLRRDPRKYARVNELLQMNEELKRSRKAFDPSSF